KPYKLEELNAIIKKWAPLVENRVAPSTD
ncbi:MAG: hypothetical protein ACI9IA_002591, partial [Enterobacterales bacterium]